MYTIYKGSSYIMVTFYGSFSGAMLRHAVCTIATNIGDAEKNGIWNFADCDSPLTYSSLFSIIAGIHDALPTTCGWNKTALVTSCNMNHSLSGLFSCGTDLLPYSIRLFRYLHEAESWVTEKLPAGHKA